MKKNKSVLAIALKRLLLVGTLLSVTPFVGLAQAQSSGSQANLLLEFQVLRQEVAELRDMVERQQYELSKVQRSTKQVLQKNAVPQAALGEATPRFEGDRAFGQSLPTQLQINEQISNTSGELGSSASTVIESQNNALLNNSTVNTVKDTNLGTTLETVAKSKSGREYPPVDEIIIDAKPDTSLSEISERVIIQNTIPQSIPEPVSKASDFVATSNTFSEARPEPTLGQIVTQREGISVSDIRPIETLSPKSIVSIPSVPESNGLSAIAIEPLSSNSVVSEEDYYQQGFNFLKESQHPEAVVIFKQQISSYPKGERADDAYYWIAESMYVNRKPNLAKENFKAIIQGYPKSERLPDAMLKLAYIEQEQGNIIEARILLQEIMQFHPKSDAALSAKKRLAEIK